MVFPARSPAAPFGCRCKYSECVSALEDAYWGKHANAARAGGLASPKETEEVIQAIFGGNPKSLNPQGVPETPCESH